MLFFQWTSWPLRRLGMTPYSERSNRVMDFEIRYGLNILAYCFDFSEQILAATPHEAPTIRPPASHHENYPTQTNQTCREELISDVLLWTPIHGRAKAGQPARTYIQQLCEDTGCSPEDLPEAMDDKEKWRERVRDIRASGMTWWWWWWWCFELRNVEEITLELNLNNCRFQMYFQRGNRFRLCRDVHIIAGCLKLVIVRTAKSVIYWPSTRP